MCFPTVEMRTVEKPQLKINSFQIYKHTYFIHNWSDKAFRGTIVNGALSSLLVGSLEITLTVRKKNGKAKSQNIKSLIYLIFFFSS